jgi:hypothetical protein
MLPPLLATLSFQCNNLAYRPVMDALGLLARYADVDGKARFFGAGEQVPFDGVVPKVWAEAVVDERGRVERIPYELCVLVAYATRYAAARSTSPAPDAGVTLKTTCPATLRPPGKSITRRCVSPPTLHCSPPSCASG